MVFFPSSASANLGQSGSNLIGPGILTLWSVAAHPVGEGKRAALGELNSYDHGYDGEIFYLGLALGER